MVPTNLPTGLDVALGRPGVGLGGLGLLGPACEAGENDPAWPLVELEEVVALMGVPSNFSLDSLLLLPPLALEQLHKT